MHKNNNMMLIFYRKSVESPDYSYTYSDIKITVEHEKTSAEFLLLRFSWCHREYFWGKIMRKSWGGYSTILLIFNYFRFYSPKVIFRSTEKLGTY